MDPSDFSLEDGFQVLHQNGVHEQQLFDSEKDGVDSLVSNGDFENFDDSLSIEEMKEGSNGKIDGDNVNVSKVRGIFAVACSEFVLFS
jgi:hypothetical protein